MECNLPFLIFLKWQNLFFSKAFFLSVLYTWSWWIYHEVFSTEFTQLHEIRTKWAKISTFLFSKYVYLNSYNFFNALETMAMRTQGDSDHITECMINVNTKTCVWADSIFLFTVLCLHKNHRNKEVCWHTCTHILVVCSGLDIL